MSSQGTAHDDDNNDDKNDAQESDNRPYNISDGVHPTPTPLGWGVAETVLKLVHERCVAGATGGLAALGAARVASLRRMYEANTLAFWTVLDQVFERNVAMRSSSSSNSIICGDYFAGVEPIPCRVPEREFVRMMLVKLWNTECPRGAVSRGTSGIPMAGHTGVAQQQQQAPPPLPLLQYRSGFRTTLGSPVCTQGDEMGTVMQAIAQVYTWTNALGVIRLIASKLSQSVGRPIAFDEQHLARLHTRYEADPLGFWSVLDQMQERMLASDWSSVRNDARFLQSFVTKFEPLDAPLSEFMAAAVPQHPLVPYGYPPTVLLRTAAAANTHSQVSFSLPSSPSHTLCVPGQLPQQQPPSIPPGCYFYGDVQLSPSLHPSCSTSNICGCARRMRQHVRGAPWDRGMDGFMLQRVPQAQELGAFDLDANYPYSWRAALEALGAIQERVYQHCRREIAFDDKHKHHLFLRWEQDPKGFFSVLDQIQERLVQTNWDAVRDAGRYIQSLVNRFEPQSVLSKFMQTFITPPDVAAASAAAEAATADVIDLTWDQITTLLFPQIEQHASQCVQREVHFDEKHKLHLKQRYDRDPCAFWSILDQVQERMATSDWSNVRDDGRFIQSFITKAEPQIPLHLSPYLYTLLAALHGKQLTPQMELQLRQQHVLQPPHSQPLYHQDEGGAVLHAQEHRLLQPAQLSPSSPPLALPHMPQARFPSQPPVAAGTTMRALPHTFYSFGQPQFPRSLPTSSSSSAASSPMFSPMLVPGTTDLVASPGDSSDSSDSSAADSIMARFTQDLQL